MEARYKLEIGENPESDVCSLSLDNCAGESLSVLSDKLTSLESLSAINCGLTSLKDLPILPTLKRLELSDNKLTGAELEHLVKSFPNVEVLGLAGNRIEKIDELSVLKKAEKLESLDVFENPVHDKDEKYRTELFDTLGNLKYLNGRDRDGNDAPSEDDDESFDEDSEEGSDDGEDDLSGSDVDDEEEDGPGLSYLQSSKIMEDEDETEDFDEDVHGAKGSKKRKAVDDENDSPSKKTKEAAEENE